jgi:hypothetical protein
MPAFLTRQEWYHSAAITLFGVAAVLLLTVAAGPFGLWRFMRVALPRDYSVTSLAQTELHRLAYSTKTTRTAKNAFEFKPLTVEDSDATELTERDWTQPERVRAFRDFGSFYRSRSDRSIIIALDELDKLAESEDVIDVINSIKDLMHSPGIHFIVSVSEDALTRFALRGIPIRDAFDSTFDLIVRVERFSVADSSALLQERVRGMPGLLILFCHILSGGVPRDLIRFARHCVDVVNLADSPLPVLRVTTEVAKAHTIALLSAYAHRVRDSGQGHADRVLEAKRDLQASPDAQPSAMLERAAKALAESDSGDAASAALAVVIGITGTACEIFGRDWTEKDWNAAKEKEPDNLGTAATRLAHCMAEVTEDPTYAAAQLNAVRQDRGLAPLDLPSPTRLPGRGED